MLGHQQHALAARLKRLSCMALVAMSLDNLTSVIVAVRFERKQS